MVSTNYYTIYDLLNEYRLKHISPVEHLQNTLKIIEKLNPKLNAFISISKQRSIKQAKLSEQNFLKKIERKLEGIPFGVKDVIDIESEKTLNGSESFINSNIKKKNAAIVKNLIDEGAIYIGKLHTHELAIGAPTLSGINKPSSNPWDLTKTAGGSSSGSGSAVGGYLVPFALGTDSGGSIRNPASMCGIVGLKPTYNSLVMDGVQPLAKTIDNVGPMARSGKDVSLVYSILKKRIKVEIKPIKELKIGVIEHFYNKDLIANDEVGMLFEKAVRIFEKNGAIISRVNVDTLKTFQSVNGVIMAKEGYLQFKNLIEENKNEIDEITFNRLILGKYISNEQYQTSIKHKKKLSLKINSMFSNFDVLITLTNFDLPFDIGNIKDIKKYYTRNARSPFNVSGHPSISIPCGLSKSGLPVGFQIVGRNNADNFIANVADEFMKKINWNKVSYKKIYENLYL